MHAGGQISEKDMKTLNKYMVNRIAGLLTTIADNNWLNLELLLSYYGLFGTEWDKAKPDTYEIDFVSIPISDGRVIEKEGKIIINS